MKRIAIVVAAVTGIVAAPAVLAADDGGATHPKGDPYELAHNVSSPLGPLYGPVEAGSGSASYGYLTR